MIEQIEQIAVNNIVVGEEGGGGGGVSAAATGEFDVKLIQATNKCVSF